MNDYTLTYTSLPKSDRRLIAIPPDAQSVSQIGDIGEPIVSCQVVSKEGSRYIKTLRAHRDPDNESILPVYNVSIDIYSGDSEDVKLTRTISFTASGDWVEQWCEMAHDEVRNTYRKTRLEYGYDDCPVIIPA